MAADPNLAVHRALFQAISQANVTLNGALVPAYAYVPTSTSAPYILLDQISTVPLNGARACTVWEPVFQLTLVTSFQNVGDDEPSLLIQEQLVNLLHGNPLPLTNNFLMGDLRVDLTTKSSKYDNNTLFVLRYIRLKMRVYQDK